MQSAFEPMRHFFKEAPLYSKVSYLESRVEELEAQNERLMDYLKIKEVATKAKESKVVLKKK
ncbi:MAG: hypothetical protein KJN62_04635 [Deltaproteobacteria bacterium]|nr:hypothetical protein [Deltaproteobacteria bacterium]